MTGRLHAMVAAICAVAAVTGTPAAWAGRLTLNDTGSIQCTSDLKEWSSDCARSRQDAAYGRDVDFPDPNDGVAGFSFRKVCRSGEMAGEGNCPPDPALGSGPDNWACVYDNVTQLTWEAKTADGGLHDDVRRYTNKGHRARYEPTEAAWLVDATNAEALCGATNWRLPDMLELQSLVAYGMAAPGMRRPLIEHTFFPNTYSRQTWTRTDSAIQRTNAWAVDFAERGWAGQLSRSSLNSARLVHRDARSAKLAHAGEGAIAKDRFIPSPEGTEVTDTLTGLIWQRCSAGMVWNNESQTCNGTATLFGWEDALGYAKAHREGGWRLPNAKELASILDPDTASPAIDQLAFPNTPQWGFLVSTAIKFNGDINALYVDFSGGNLGSWDFDIQGNLNLRLVRRGRE